MDKHADTESPPHAYTSTLRQSARYVWACAARSPQGLSRMNVEKEVLRVLDEVLSLNGRSAAFSRHTQLLGAVPELDSMAAVSIVTAFEQELGVAVDDGDIDGNTFATVGSLIDFVAERVGP